MDSEPIENAGVFCVVVGLSFTDSGTHAFEEAARIARRIPGCALHLVHVADGEPAETKTRDLAGHLRLYAREKIQSLGGLPGITIGIHVRPGERVAEIARFAHEVRADLILLGSDKRHFRDWYAAPVVDKLMGLAPCPVVVAGPRTRASELPAPAIEPPCSDCLHARAASKGATWWCARHSEHAKRAHTFSYQRELPLRSHDSAIIPTGVDL